MRISQQPRTSTSSTEVSKKYLLTYLLQPTRKSCCARGSLRRLNTIHWLRGEATGAALDFPAFVAAVARTAFAHANPRYEPSGLYAIPPWPVTRATGGQHVEPAYSANVQGLVQLPEAFHLLMRHTLG